jgi:hypothetical protein
MRTQRERLQPDRHCLFGSGRLLHWRVCGWRVRQRRQLRTPIDRTRNRAFFFCNLVSSAGHWLRHWTPRVPLGSGVHTRGDC